MFLDNKNNLTPVFRNTVEKFIQEWLDTILPHYYLAKEKNVDILELSNVICYSGEQFEHNGFRYIYYVDGSGMSYLTLDGSDGHYTRIGFRECIVKMFPDLDVSPDPDSLVRYSKIRCTSTIIFGDCSTAKPLTTTLITKSICILNNSQETTTLAFR